ncbi:unnamed protein product [Pieris macdunnoughi]|uniref:Uncharacterized protein n=1 Tax=Pieris macdunnoughi TaxID=345717 RepID=A0A821TQ77_9NEOP|nr:unnamed protein product [Pieris macdunnoughi]
MGKVGSKSLSSLQHCTLWKADRSPSCRAVLMALDAMDISVTEVDVDMDKAEHKSKEIIDMNPFQTLPVFKDRNLILIDSHSINMYLASRYFNCDKMLPKDPGGRAIIDQFMMYNCGTLQPKYRAAADPILYENCRFVLPDQICEIETAYSDLDEILAARPWITGSLLSIADISIASTISTLNILVPVDKNRFPNLVRWMYKMSEEYFYGTANEKGLEEFSKRIDTGHYGDDQFKACPQSSSARRSRPFHLKNM